jgi:hypothetical protein
MVRSLTSGLLIATLVAAAGCQGEPSLRFAPVEGTVTRGGKPLAGVIVVFWADSDAGTPGPCSSGPTDAAGHYELHTEQGEPGAVVGRHWVCIVQGRAVLGRMARGKADRSRLREGLAAPAAAAVPPRYADRKQTPLRAEVRPGVQVIDLEVK